MANVHITFYENRSDGSKVEIGGLKDSTVMSQSLEGQWVNYIHPEVEEQLLGSNQSGQSPDLLSGLDANEKQLPPSWFQLSVNMNVQITSTLNSLISACNNQIHSKIHIQNFPVLNYKASSKSTSRNKMKTFENHPSQNTGFQVIQDDNVSPGKQFHLLCRSLLPPSSRFKQSKTRCTNCGFNIYGPNLNPPIQNSFNHPHSLCPDFSTFPTYSV